MYLNHYILEKTNNSYKYIKHATHFILTFLYVEVIDATKNYVFMKNVI